MLGQIISAGLNRDLNFRDLKRLIRQYWRRELLSPHCRSLELNSPFTQLDRGPSYGHDSRPHVSLVYLVRIISNALATPTYATISFRGSPIVLFRYSLSARSSYTGQGRQI